MKTDLQIIDLFWQRDQEAIRELSQSYGNLCRGIIRNLLGDSGDVEECLQDTWLALWNAIPPERPEPLGAFVCRVARNQALKRYHANTARMGITRNNAAVRLSRIRNKLKIFLEQEGYTLLLGGDSSYLFFCANDMSYHIFCSFEPDVPTDFLNSLY